MLEEGGRNSKHVQGAGKQIFIFVLLLNLAFNISKSKRHFKRNTIPRNSILKGGSFLIKINFKGEKCTRGRHFREKGLRKAFE